MIPLSFHRPKQICSLLFSYREKNRALPQGNRKSLIPDHYRVWNLRHSFTNQFHHPRIRHRFLIQAVYSSDIAYNLRFSSRLSNNHPNVWTSIQLIKSEHVRLEHIIVQISAGATQAFQRRLVILSSRFLDKKFNVKELLVDLSSLISE